MLRTKKNIIIAKSNRKKEFDGIEYEIKLECIDKNKTLSELLKLVELAIDSSNLYQTDKVRTKTEMVSYFFVDKKNEYSIFRYEEKVMLKIKKHNILKSYKFPIFKNTENFMYNLSEIAVKLESKNIVYVGNMIKRRIKDFVIDNQDGRIYSLAITICETLGQLQHQLEVEYYGYLPGYGKLDENNESEILERLFKLTNFIYKTCKNEFIPSIERKYEFVTKYSTLNGDEASLQKSRLLSNLENI